LLNNIPYYHPSSTEWVVFVHGAGGSSAIWYKQIRAFKEKYNVVLLDLRGHGKSKISDGKTKYTFDLITSDIIEVLDFLKIEKAHFVGVSLGAILIINSVKNHASRIQSIVFSGAIVKLNTISNVLIVFGNAFKSIIPYMILYRFFAYIIMPYRKHRESRNLFITEAKKVGSKEFVRWYQLTAKLPLLLARFRESELKIPTLYIMGSEDHLYLPSVKQLVKKQPASQLIIVENSGHVVNVQEPIIFNTKALSFLKQQKIN